ncbi:MAG: helix-turn-helix transcriptional regulator [Ignavibacteria bacterium]
MLEKFGQDLKKLRESKKITIADISVKTKIHKSILEKMESGDFSFFSEIHVRAFLKQYAKAISVDSNELLFNYSMAKQGKFSSMLKDVEEKEVAIKKIEENTAYMEEPELPPEIKNPTVEETPKESEEDIFSFPSKHEKQLNKDLPNKPAELPEQKNEIPERKPFSKSKRVKLEPEDTEFNGTYTEIKGFKVPIHLLKNLGIALMIIALLAGIYLLIDVVFLKKQNQNVDIVKQNFDEVVQENEKKILGKKTEEEIQDSINKVQDSLRKAAIADSLKNLESEFLRLKIVGLKKGKILIYIDTLVTGGGELEEVSENSKGEFKAKKQFYITSKNTDNFDAYLNDKKLIFEDVSVKNLKLSRKTLLNE